VATPLDKPLKRELVIDGTSYMLTITPEGVKITEKGRRLGREMTWRDLLSGDAQLASQLLQSVSAVEPKSTAETNAPKETGAQRGTKQRRRAQR
jgi:hypothetical protein